MEISGGPFSERGSVLGEPRGASDARWRRGPVVALANAIQVGPPEEAQLREGDPPPEKDW